MTTTIRDFAEKDLESIVSLLNKEYGDDPEFIPFNKERVCSQISKHGLEAKVAENDSHVVGLVATHPEGASEESIHWLATEEPHNDRPVENILVRYIEEQSQGEYVSTMIAEGSSKISNWLARGYVLCPGFQRMTAKLDKKRPIPDLPAGTVLRSLRPDEEEKLVEVINAGFGWERLEKGTIEEWKSDDPLFNEEWIHVAEVEGKIVSAVVSKQDADHMEHFGIRRGYLGPAATLPEYRNKHIARALTARAMNFLLDRGMTIVRLGTAEKNVSSQALLRSLGFQADSTRKILRKKLTKKNETSNASDTCLQRKTC
jgi:ribosomal protein S18 acetylase RimI-like enzyme